MQFKTKSDNKKNDVINGALYIVSTPIGNLDDITIRALDILKKCDLILCEDTRRSVKLLNHYNIKTKLSAYHKFNEQRSLSRIIDIIKKEKSIALISDAGTPIISDPGVLLINKCVSENIKIIPIPGPSAPTTALSVSGFSDKYIFLGFLPKKEIEINKSLTKISDLDFSFIFFIPATKINFYLKFFKEYFSNRKIFLAKEMTKIFEDFTTYPIELMGNLPKDAKGEYTVVISQPLKNKKTIDEVNESVRIEIRKMIKKYSIKDVVSFICKKENLKKKIVYNLCLKIKNEI